LERAREEKSINSRIIGQQETDQTDFVEVTPREVGLTSTTAFAFSSTWAKSEPERLRLIEFAEKIVATDVAFILLKKSTDCLKKRLGGTFSLRSTRIAD